MSEESNFVISSTEKDENLIAKVDKNSRPVSHSDEPPATENGDVPADHVQETLQPIEPTREQIRPILGSLERNVEAMDLSFSYQQQSPSDASTEIKSSSRSSDDKIAVQSTTSDASAVEAKVLERDSDNSEPPVKSTISDGSTETKSSEKTSDDQPAVKSSDESTEIKPAVKSSDELTETKPAVKSSASSEISPSEAPSSDEGLKGVTENIQLIYEGLKDLKISTQEIPESASAKKVRKTPSTPRARSTPVLTSPPLTRSRSRDMRKFPSTPASPRSLASRKNSESDSDDIKDARGRRKAKKN